ncbi:hypothetical protein HBB16_18085 [Pseudonocardia sp. MCCB 268]|nr:hypothetical protein [Pseudonocardia cytotoxica]
MIPDPPAPDDVTAQAAFLDALGGPPPLRPGPPRTSGPVRRRAGGPPHRRLDDHGAADAGPGRAPRTRCCVVRHRHHPCVEAPPPSGRARTSSRRRWRRGGHRGTTDLTPPRPPRSGCSRWIPWLADALRSPVVAAGALPTAESVAAALTWASGAGRDGTPLHPEAYRRRLGCHPRRPRPGGHRDHPAYTGRLALAFRPATSVPDPAGRPAPAPYPHQRDAWSPATARGAGWRDRSNPLGWQAAARASTDPAGEVVARMWREADDPLP